MKFLKKIVASIIIVISCFMLISCSSKSSEKIKGCSFSLLDNGEEYEISQEYKLFSKGPKGDLIIPDTYKELKVTSIGSFGCCHEITSITGNVNITTIPSSAFSCRCVETNQQGKMKLTKVQFSKDASLTTIDNEAFFKCSKWEEIYLTDCFEKFGDGVFYGCIRLKKIYIYNTVPPQGADNLFKSGNAYHNPNEELVIYVPVDALETYKSSIWNKFTIEPISDNT